MKYRIIADSSSNLLTLKDINFVSVPLKITTNEKEYIDHQLDIPSMLMDLRNYKGEVKTSSPTVEKWLEAFGDADIIFGLTLTSQLSESFHNAMIAKRQYEKQYPQKKIYIIDSLSAGPELTLIVNKLVSLMKLEKSYKDIRNTILDYMRHTHLTFSLPSIENIASDRKINPLLAKYYAILGIHVIGKANYDGKLEPLEFVANNKKSLKKLLEEMKSCGYHGGKVIISHTDNEEGSLSLMNMIKNEFKDACIEIMTNAGLCSYYADTGGILVGFES